MGKIAGGASVDMAPKMPVVTAFTFSTPNRTSVVEIAVARVVVTVVFALAWVAVSVTFPGTDVKDGGGFVVCPLVSNVVLIDGLIIGEKVDSLIDSIMLGPAVVVVIEVRTAVDTALSVICGLAVAEVIKSRTAAQYGWQEYMAPVLPRQRKARSTNV